MKPLIEQHSNACDRILVLSANGAAAPGTAFRSAAEQLGWAVLESAAAGMALRQIALTRPAGVIVLVGSEHYLEPCVSLIADLRRYQPQLPLVAVADAQNERVERRLRAAGATAYLAGGPNWATEAADLISSARAHREPPELLPRVYPARSPPARQGRRAPPRIRGRPRPRTGAE